MKQHLRRLFRWTAWAVAAASVTMLATVVFLFTTEAGARVVLRIFTARVPLDIEYSDVQGSLRGPLSVIGFSAATPALELQAERIMFDLRPLQLVRGRVHTDSIRLVEVRARRVGDTVGTEQRTTVEDTPDQVAHDSVSFELPVTLVIDAFHLERGSLSVSDSIRLSDISVAASGTEEDYKVTLSAALELPRVASARLTSSGHGTLSAFNLDSLRVALLDGEVRGSGRISWQNGIEWRAALTADSLAPSVLAPKPEDWPGRISLSAAIEGSHSGSLVLVDARVDTLFGILRDQPVTGLLTAGMRGSDYSLDRAHLDWGPVWFDAAGVAISEQLNLEFELRAPNLAAVLPDAGGSLSASGSVTGSSSAPIIIATAEANAVAVDKLELAHAHAKVDVEWQEHGRNEVDLRIDDLRYTEWMTDSVEVLINGSREAHEVRVVGAGRDTEVRLAASGGMHDGKWSGVLRDVFVATRQAGAWELAAPSSLTASKDEVMLEELCMRATEGDLCVRGAWESQAAWDVRSSMNGVPLSLLQPLLPEPLAVSGHVSGDVVAAGQTGLPTSVELDLTQAAGSSTYALQDTVATLAYRDVRLSVKADDDSTSVSLNAWLAETDVADFGSMTVDLKLGSLAELVDDRSTHGLMAAVADEWTFRSSLDGVALAILAPLLPQQSSVSGTVSGQLSTSGQQGAPEYLEFELRPSPGSFTYVSQDKEEVIRHQETRLALATAGDSLIGNVSLQLASDSGADFGSFSAEFSLSSIAELIERVVADSGINSLTGDWTLASSIGSMPISLAHPLMPDSLIVDGTINGRISASGTARMPGYLDLELAPSRGTLEYRLRDTVAALEYRDAKLSVKTEGDSLVGNLRLEIGSGNDTEFGTLSATAGLPALADLMDEISAEGVLSALLDEWEISSTVDQVPLAIFNGFVPAGATLAGSLDGDLDASAAADGTLTGRLELRPRTATTQRYFGSAVHTVRLTDTKVRLSAGSGGARGEATFAVARPDGPLQGTIAAAITVPQLTRLDQPLLPQPFEATVEGDMDLSLLDELFGDFSDSEGRFNIDLKAGNTFDEIEVTGNYRLRGQTDVVSLGIELRDVDIRASESPEGGLAIEGSVSSGGGRLTIKGLSPAIPTRESPARLTIRGRDFQALRTEQVSLLVSPDLEVLASGQSVDVRGEIDVPRASIELLEIPQAAVSPSRDVMYVGQTDEARSQPIDVSAEVNLTLGENVVFRGLGFSTHLDGSILAIERPGGVTQGRGELVFREGIYRGYGQNLSVEPGRLIFAGPIDDPAVDVRAYRRATDGTRAGFLVGGTLKSLEMDVWSEPAKTDSDALSYILFGRPLSQGTESDQVQAANAAAVLGGNMLAMSMASKIGLDDARIETGARQQETAFYAGKYLSPRVYVAYGVGLYEPINVLRVRYLISRKFTLQTETGTRDSVDILYRIEF